MIQILFTILFLIVITIYYLRNNVIENFDDLFEDHEKYEEIYDNEFINLYEIIYRDFTDVKFDTNILYSKIKDNLNEKSKILVCGSGVGKLCKQIKENYIDIIGLDISQNMLLKAQSLYPNIKFMRGDMIKSNIFKKDTFDLIMMDERSLYYNKPENFELIISNIYHWIKSEGYFAIPIYDPDKLQLACRYYSSKYMDDKGNFHGFTYLNDFSHDCYYIKEEENSDVFHYYDKVIFDSGLKRIKKTTFYIPPKEKVYDIILKNGFDLVYIEKIRIQIVGGYEFAIFRKKKNISTVQELQNKIK